RIVNALVPFQHAVEEFLGRTLQLLYTKDIGIEQRQKPLQRRRPRRPALREPDVVGHDRETMRHHRLGPFLGPNLPESGIFECSYRKSPSDNMAGCSTLPVFSPLPVLF